MTHKTPPPLPEPTDDILRARRRKHRSILVISLLVIALAFVLKVRADQRVHLVGLPGLPVPPTCTTRYWLGIPCPGCGLTRSFIALADGDFQTSWNYNRVGWLLALGVLLQVPYRLLALRYPKLAPFGTGSVAVAATLVGTLLIANWMWSLYELGWPPFLR